MANNSRQKNGEAGLQSRLKEVRQNLGLSQQELAQAAGITRQTIGGIEAALFSPSAAVALRLARALGCRVEEIFWLENEPETLIRAYQAESFNLSASPVSDQVTVAKVGKRWITHNLSGDAAFRWEMVPADGLVTSRGADKSLTVRLMDTPEALEQTILLAGCAPAFSLWLRSAERWHPRLRATWLHANSSQSLEALFRDEVHIAGIHLHDPETGEDNEPFVRRLQVQRPRKKVSLSLVNFGVWDEGFMVAAGNPQKILSVKDLEHKGITIINREVGAGARLLLDSLLTECASQPDSIRGYENTVNSHQVVARTIAHGTADAGIGTLSIASIYGLDFVPLRRVRFDLALKTESLQHEPIQKLLETLRHRRVLQQLQKLGGYDTTHTGEIIAQL